jgi:hypothetical protein
MPNLTIWRAASAVLLLSASACGPAPLSKRILGRYVNAAEEGTRVLEVQPDGRVVLTESTARSGVSRQEGVYTVARESVYVTFPEKPYGLAGTLRGDTLSMDLRLQSMHIPQRFVREP